MDILCIYLFIQVNIKRNFLSNAEQIKIKKHLDILKLNSISILATHPDKAVHLGNRSRSSSRAFCTSPPITGLYFLGLLPFGLILLRLHSLASRWDRLSAFLIAKLHRTALTYWSGIEKKYDFL